MMSMKLITSNLTLHYFPVDALKNPNDFPKYALQSKDEDSYDIQPLTQNDHLILSEYGGVCQLKINDTLIGLISSKDTPMEQVNEFVTSWNKGLEMIKESTTDDVDGDEIIGSLRKRLHSYKDSLNFDKELSLRVVSWNLHGDPIYENPAEKFTSLLKDDDSDVYPDIIIVCFQETIPLNAKNLSSSPERVSNWELKLLSHLPSNYKKIKSNRLLGLTLMFLSTEELEPQINNITTSTIGTGLLGIWANKGAIVMNFKIGFDDMCGIEGLDLQIFNCHLASGHGREMLDHRRKELFDIQRKFHIIGDGKLLDENWVGDDAEYEKYLYYENELDEMTNDMNINDDMYDEEYDEDENELLHTNKVADDNDNNNDDDDANAKGITMFCGDLNYRVFMEKSHVEQCLQTQDFKTLLELEGLTQEKKTNKIFINFKEGEINFKPTYKFNANDEYDFNRIPSYCDRILYTPHHCIRQSSYAPLFQMHSSDHKPIVSNFQLKAKLINFDKKSEIVSAYFKEQDKLENESRPIVEISRQDIPMLENHFLIPNETETILKNNGDSINLSWEIILLENNDDDISSGIVTIYPMSGQLAPGREQVIKIEGVLPIGVTEYANTSILRVHNAQDFFISYSFKSKKSIFGLDLAELGQGSSGIPKSIYQLVNFLSEHNYQGMFEDDLKRFNDLDYKLIKDLDDGEDLDVDFLKKQLLIESITSVSRLLLLILKNLPNGVVSKDYTIRLIKHFYNNNSNKNLIKMNGVEEIILYLLEILPRLQANLLIFMCNFLKILIKDYHFDKLKLMKIFQNVLLQIPTKISKRKFVTDSNVRNLKKRRNELLSKLLSD